MTYIGRHRLGCTLGNLRHGTEVTRDRVTGGGHRSLYPSVPPPARDNLRDLAWGSFRISQQFLVPVRILFVLDPGTGAARCRSGWARTDRPSKKKRRPKFIISREILAKQLPDVLKEEEEEGEGEEGEGVEEAEAEEAEVGEEGAEHTKITMKSAVIKLFKVLMASKVIKKSWRRLVTGDPLYLYLMDELTGEPVCAEGWPIKITISNEVAKQLLPAFVVGLRAMDTLYGAAGVARMFGYRVPNKWIKDVRQRMRNEVVRLKKTSSVEEYGAVQDTLGAMLDAQLLKKDSDALRGHARREFVNFLKRHDPGLKKNECGDFAGLRRIGDPNDGTALWTTLSDKAEIEAALEKRARKREAAALIKMLEEKNAELMNDTKAFAHLAIDQ